MTEVKICGLKDATHIRVAAESGADWVGFVLYAKSPRHVLEPDDDSLSALQDLVKTAADFGVNSAVLVVDPDEEQFRELVLDVRPNAIQLHGSETRALVERMWRDCDGSLELWKALSIDADTDLEHLENWMVDRLLIDAKPPEASQLPGGNGITFDWDLLHGHEFSQPWILAGGLTIENVAAAIRATGAPMVDVSSGVETLPGLKDEELIRAFIDGAKSV